MISIDPQANGYHDDGTESGLIRVDPARSDLVLLPWRNGHFVTGGIINKDATGDDSAGTSTTVAITTAANSGLNVSPGTIEWPFYGNVLGIRWDRNYDTTYNDFCVYVDGVAYQVAATRLNWSTQAAWNVTDGYNRQVVARDLGDGMHWAKIVCEPGLTGTLKWLFYGYAVERRAGYVTPSPARVLLGPTVLATTAATAISYGSNVGRYPRGFRKITFLNVSAGSATLTLYYGGSTGATQIEAAQTIAAGNAYTYDPGDVLTVDYSQFKVQASVASAIQYTVIGAF